MSSASTPAPRPTMNVTAIAVFKTYELLELILLQLPMEDVYVVQRISTIWRDTIARSQDLQKNMFRMAAGSPRKPDKSIYGKIRRVAVAGSPTPAQDIGPIYEGSYLQFNPAIHIGYYLLHDEDGGCPRKSNGCIPSMSQSFPIEMRVAEWENGDERDFLQFTCREVEAGQLEYYRYNAALRSMFLTQPPVTGIQLQTKVRHRYGWEARMSLYNSEGVTFGDVFDGLQSHVTVGEDPISEVVLVFSQKVPINSKSERAGWCQVCHWIESVR